MAIKAHEPSGPEDPYVAYVKHRLEALLQLVDLEIDGEVVHVTGFRLKENLSAELLTNQQTPDVMGARSSGTRECKGKQRMNSESSLCIWGV